jgi:hypothetical protein
MAVESGLDLREIVFLDWFGFWAGHGTMDHHEHEGKIYWWVSRQKVIDDLPILGFSSPSKVSTFITGLIEKGLLARVTVTNKARRGKRSYLRTTVKWAALKENHVPESERENVDHVPESERENVDHVPESKRETPRPRSENGTSDSPTIRDSPTRRDTSRAPARGPKPPPPMKDELARYIDESMRAVQPYENFGRERKQITTIAATCRRRDPERPQDVADAMMGMLQALRQNGDQFWQRQPFTPSFLMSQWERIEQEGTRIADQYRERREFEEWVNS